MAFFKFRKGGDEQPTPPSSASESVEVMRKRARHRLIGAAVLVLVGVIGFPLLFDSQPRPIAVDIPIEIPDKAKVTPLGTPQVATNHAAPSQVSGGVIDGGTPAPVASAPAKPEPKPDAKPAPKAEAKPETIITEPKPAPKAEVKPAAKAEAKPEPKPVVAAEKPAAKPTEASKAQALLDGKPAADKPAEKKPDAAEGRYVVQVGAYVEAAKLREARQKVESLGFKTYTQVVGAKDAQRTRVRIGPFANKAEAQKAADKIKKLSLPAAILEL